jgi:hypothetical protein
MGGLSFRLNSPALLASLLRLAQGAGQDRNGIPITLALITTDFSSLLSLSAVAEGSMPALTHLRSVLSSPSVQRPGGLMLMGLSDQGQRNDSPRRKVVTSLESFGERLLKPSVAFALGDVAFM